MSCARTRQILPPLLCLGRCRGGQRLPRSVSGADGPSAAPVATPRPCCSSRFPRDGLETRHGRDAANLVLLRESPPGTQASASPPSSCQHCVPPMALQQLIAFLGDGPDPSGCVCARGFVINSYLQCLELIPEPERGPALDKAHSFIIQSRCCSWNRFTGD